MLPDIKYSVSSCVSVCKNDFCVDGVCAVEIVPVDAGSQRCDFKRFHVNFQAFHVRSFPVISEEVCHVIFCVAVHAGDLFILVFVAEYRFWNAAFYRDKAWLIVLIPVFINHYENFFKLR